MDAFTSERVEMKSSPQGSPVREERGTHSGGLSPVDHCVMLDRSYWPTPRQTSTPSGSVDKSTVCSDLGSSIVYSNRSTQLKRPQLIYTTEITLGSQQALSTEKTNVIEQFDQDLTCGAPSFQTSTSSISAFLSAVGRNVNGNAFTGSDCNGHFGSGPPPRTAPVTCHSA